MLSASAIEQGPYKDWYPCATQDCKSQSLVPYGYCHTYVGSNPALTCRYPGPGHRGTTADVRVVPAAWRLSLSSIPTRWCRARTVAMRLGIDAGI